MSSHGHGKLRWIWKQDFLERLWFLYADKVSEQGWRCLAFLQWLRPLCENATKVIFWQSATMYYWQVIRWWPRKENTFSLACQTRPSLKVFRCPRSSDGYGKSRSIWREDFLEGVCILHAAKSSLQGRGCLAFQQICLLLRPLCENASCNRSLFEGDYLAACHYVLLAGHSMMAKKGKHVFFGLSDSP